MEYALEPVKPPPPPRRPAAAAAAAIAASVTIEDAEEYKHSGGGGGGATVGTDLSVAPASAAAAGAGAESGSPDRLLLEAEVLCRADIHMDISAPVRRPTKDECSHLTSARRDVPIEVTDNQTVHGALLHINLQALAVPLRFSQALKEGLLLRMMERDLGEKAKRNTATLYCRNLEDYVPAGTSVDEYFARTLDGKYCTAMPAVSYIFGELRNPVTPLLRRPPGDLPLYANHVWLDDVECEKTPMSRYAGPAVRNYFYLVCMQCWLCVNNQFVRRRVYAADKPFYLTALSPVDCHEATEEAVEKATEELPPRPPPTGLTRAQLDFYDRLDRLEQDIFWMSYPLSGRALANLAETLSFHEFILAVQCKFFTTFLTADERKNFVRNLDTIALAIRFRLCEFPNYQEFANATIRDKLSKDAENPAEVKRLRGERRTDPDLRSNEKLGINAKTTVLYEESWRNASTKSVYSLIPKDVQRRLEPVPFFWSHARFAPFAPIVTLGHEKRQHVKEAVWQIAAYLNVEDRNRLQTKMCAHEQDTPNDGAQKKKKTSLYFRPVNEPECVKIRGPHLLYLVIQPTGNLEVLYAVHPTAFYLAHGSAAAAAANGTTKIVRRPPTPTTPATSGSKRKQASGASSSSPQQPTGKRAPIKKQAGVMTAKTVPDIDSVMACSPYPSVFSPDVMTADLLQRFYESAPNFPRLDYSSPHTLAGLGSLSTGDPRVAPWSPTENLTFMDKVFRARATLRTSTRDRESMIWEVILHATAAMNLPHGTVVWRDRRAWVPRALEFLRTAHTIPLDSARYRERARDALAAARFDPQSDADILSALAAVFRYDSGLDTYSKFDMRPINRRFDAHFFTPERILPLLESRGIALELNGRPLPVPTLNRLLGVLCEAVRFGRPVDGNVFDIRLTARYHNGTERSGRDMAAAILELWMKCVKQPLFFHAQYISNPPIGARLSEGNEWARPGATSASSSSSTTIVPADASSPSGDTAECYNVPAQITKARTSLMASMTTVAGTAQFARFFARYDQKSNGDNLCNIGVALGLAEAIRRRRRTLQQAASVSVGANKDALTQLDNAWAQMRLHAHAYQRALTDVFDLEHSNITGGGGGGGGGAGGGVLPASIPWRHQLKRLVARGVLVMPVELSAVFDTAMLQATVDELPRLERVVGLHLADLCRETPKAMLLPFARRYLTFDQKGQDDDCRMFYDPLDVRLPDAVIRSIMIVLVCFAELRIPHYVNSIAAAAAAEPAPPPPPPPPAQACAAAAAAAAGAGAMTASLFITPSAAAAAAASHSVDLDSISTPLEDDPSPQRH